MTGSERVMRCKMAAKQSMRHAPWRTLGVTFLYLLPTSLLSMIYQLVLRMYGESVTNVRLYACTAAIVLADLVLIQPMLYGLMRIYTCMMHGKRPAAMELPLAFGSVRLWFRSVRMALCMLFYSAVWAIPCGALLVLGWYLSNTVGGTLGMFLLYECIFVGILLYLGCLCRYLCGYVLLVEQPELGCWKAARLAARTFRGHNRTLLSFVCSFVLWGFLIYLTEGILLLYVYPYFVLALFWLFKSLCMRTQAATEPADDAPKSSE